VIELQNYEHLGGMTGAIQYAVQRIVPSRLPPETEQALRLCFVRHLVQVNEKDEFVRRPSRWSDLPGAAHPLLEQFVDERLLHTSGEGSATIVEVSHEALFRCWPELTRWLQDSYQVVRWRRDVQRDRVSAGNSWTGLTRAQLAVSRRWVREIPGELSHEEVVWIFRAIRRERLVRSTAVAIIFLVCGLGMTAWYQRLAAVSAGIEARHSKEAAVIALTTSLKMFTEPTEIAGEIAAAVSDRRPTEVEKAFNRFKSNSYPTVTSADVAKATEHLQEAIRNWNPSEATSWNPEEEPTSEAIRQAVLSLATAVRDAWESQFPIDGAPEFRKARELARKILVESKYHRTMAVTSRIAKGSREQKDLDALEQLYWSELVFLEDEDVKTKMIKFRRTVRGYPEYSQTKLGDVVNELNVACQNALETFE
jgi:hypothetical protein